MTTQETVTLCSAFITQLRSPGGITLAWLEQHVKVCPICRAVVEEEKESGEDSDSSSPELNKH